MQPIETLPFVDLTETEFTGSWAMQPIETNALTKVEYRQIQSLQGVGQCSPLKLRMICSIGI